MLVICFDLKGFPKRSMEAKDLIFFVNIDNCVTPVLEMYLYNAPPYWIWRKSLETFPGNRSRVYEHVNQNH